MVSSGYGSHDFNIEYDRLTKSRFSSLDVKKQTVSTNEDAHVNYMKNGWVCVLFFDGRWEIWESTQEMQNVS